MEIRNLVILISLLLTAGCGTTTRTASVPSERVKAEEQFQRELAIRAGYDLDTRLQNVGLGLLYKAAAICAKNTSYSTGIYLSTKHTYGKSADAAEKILGFDDNLKISNVPAESPAAKAGLRRGDIIIAVNGVEIQTGPEAVKKAREVFGRAKADTVYNVTYRRDGATRTVVVRPQQKCSYPLLLGQGNEVNAYADGKRIIISRGMMMFASDDLELSFVIAHELAHNVMSHIDAKTTNYIAGSVLDVIVSTGTGVGTQGTFGKMGAQAFSQDFEREADYVGLYVLANAGMDIEKAPAFWRRMAALNPGSIASNHAATHPATPERFVAMEETIKEIRGKQKKGQPLKPELKSTP